MRKLLSTILLLLALSATGQTRRLLTMEEAILSRELIPQNYSIVWDSNHPNQYLHKSDTTWYAIDIRSGCGCWNSVFGSLFWGVNVS